MIYEIVDNSVDEHMAGFCSEIWVTLEKPRPDVYLYACEKIGRKPEECMAVEDSPNGVNAAYQAGCHVTMVPDLTPADEEVKKMADHVVPDLRGLLEYLK